MRRSKGRNEVKMINCEEEDDFNNNCPMSRVKVIRFLVNMKFL